ncbi:MAG: hypothetical protein FWG40_01195 [Peptococcaceae bacterium]|nr:hypothetical protein [Peptococcaceae bacterium]
MSEIIESRPAVENPFISMMPDHVNAGAVTIESARAVGEVQSRMVIAKRFPRDQGRAFDEVMIACGKKALAEQAEYSYPRGGQTVSGPSIRLAEEMARHWGNIEYGIKELSQKDGESEMEAYAWDLETNTRSAITFAVKHIRKTKKETQRLDDPRDIYELIANQGSRRKRACILAVLPPQLTDAAVKKCRETLVATVDVTKDSLEKMIRKFAVFGVEQEHIEKRIGSAIEGASKEGVAELRTIYNSIADGMSKPGDWFEIAPRGIEAARSLTDALFTEE